MARPRQWRGAEALTLAHVAGVKEPTGAMCLLVDDLLRDTGQEEPPINLSLVASFQDIYDITRLAMKEAAMITPTPRGLRVFINSQDPVGRQNFSVCHEICHTLFPHFRAHPIVKDAQTGTFSVKSEEEWLCDFGASRLLLPPPPLREKALRYGPGIQAIIQLAEDFEASIEATAIAWAALDLWPYAVVVFEERLKPSEIRRQHQIPLPTMEEEMRAEPQLRVSLPCIPPSLNLFIPKHKSVSRDGAIYRALANQDSSAGKDILLLRNGPQAMDTESVFAPYRRHGLVRNRVVSLLRPS